MTDEDHLPLVNNTIITSIFGELENATNSIWTAELVGSKLGMCEGSCRDDEDCTYGLICYNATEKVPGCYEEPLDRARYCTFPLAQEKQPYMNALIP